MNTMKNRPKKLPEVSPETIMAEQISRMARRTWEVIASDLSSAMSEAGEGLTLSLAVEAVGDADYMLTHGKDKEAYAAFQAMEYEAQDALLRKALKGCV